MKIRSLSPIIASILIAGCLSRYVEREIISNPVHELSDYQILKMKVLSPFLKVHMKNGNVYVFDSWDIDDTRLLIYGNATLHTPLRDISKQGQFTIGLDSVAILESNVIRYSGSATAITVFTGITAAITVYCIANPKACFGSCPTFYVYDGDSLRLSAEGFSSSIAPSLEASDVDALYFVQPQNGEVIVEMRNEALETHVVRYVDLLVVPKENGKRVFKEAGNDTRFWQTLQLIQPISAVGPEGDCLSQLLEFDGKERFSFSDESYLAEKEIIDLEFTISPNNVYGLVLGSRQTLLQTYLLYQALAYMGNEAGHFLAEIERGNIGGSDSRITQIIGGIEVLAQTPEGDWHVVREIKEHGPLASDLHMIVLGELDLNQANLKLRMTKGAWRIDYVALGELSQEMKPIRIAPSRILKQGTIESEVRDILLDNEQVLVTLPGDSYTLIYKLPDGDEDYEFFLDSRGYYLEWIRKEWIEEQNLFLLSELFLAPERALKRLAPEFKLTEPQMEELFWRSRYAKP